MASHVRWGLIVRIAAIAVLAPVVCLAAYVPIQQRILRWRAERLLADIRQIQMGKSTWADAQHLMHRWGEWGGYEGSCTAQHCNYQIAFEDLLRALPAYFLPSGDLLITPRKCCHWLWKPYLGLGGRFALIAAGIEVKNGIIWTKSFEIETSVFPRRHPPLQNDGFALVGGADGVTRFPIGRYLPGLDLHPEYSIGEAPNCEGCRSVSAHFTRFADPEIIHQIFEFNLSCLTQWNECENTAEIMPSAMRIYRAEAGKPFFDREAAATHKQPLEIVGRDFKYAEIAEIQSIRRSNEFGHTMIWADLQPFQGLKNGASGRLREAPIGGVETVLPGGAKVADLKPGNKLILLFESSPDNSCSFITYSDETIKALRRGTALDVLSEIP